MAKWVGYAVSVNCGEPLGCYQGTILEADGNTITLTKAFRNGFPYPKSQVTLNAADIKDLKIIESRTEPAEQTHSTVAVAKSGKKAARATVCENLQANPSNSGGHGHAGTTTKSRGTGGGGGGGGAAGGHEKARRRNEACFGEAADLGIDRDFDFEGNLALFDKRALWEQMNNQKPDLVRQADEAGKFRHDENVLGGGGCGAAARRAIALPAALRAAGGAEYVTDEGVVVPAAGPRLRRALWAGLARAGLADTARVLLARAAADVCVRLVGGGRRLEPRNAHQAPTVSVVAGATGPGVAALVAARLLASHGARVHCHVLAAAAAAAGPDVEAALRREAAALAAAEVRVAERLEQLPRADLVLLALHDPVLDEPPDHYDAAVAWAVSSRAACVCLEGAPGGGAGSAAGALACRACVCALLPPALPPALGRVFLADVAPPPRLFSELDVRYRPPFGAQPLLALHPADD